MKLDSKTRKLWLTTFTLTPPNSILELPMKSAIYGTLTGLMNAKNMETGGHIVKMAAELLQDSLDKQLWRNVKLLLRFFGELVNSNVILPTTLLNLMGQLLSVLEEPTVIRVRVSQSVLPLNSGVVRIHRRLTKDCAISDYDFAFTRLVPIAPCSLFWQLCLGVPPILATVTLTILKRS